jgi:hypothetical protein
MVVRILAGASPPRNENREVVLTVFLDEDGNQLGATEWIARRRRQVASRPSAEAAGRDAWAVGTRAGSNPPGVTSTDLVNLGNISPSDIVPLRQEATKECKTQAAFSAIGPHQAKNTKDALGITPPVGSVAINPQAFGIPYGESKAQNQRGQALVNRYRAGITVSAPSLDGTPNDMTTFTIGDVGDLHIRQSRVPRFDIYRFPTLKDARRFGLQSADTTIRGVPVSWDCP